MTGKKIVRKSIDDLARESGFLVPETDKTKKVIRIKLDTKMVY